MAKENTPNDPDAAARTEAAKQSDGKTAGKGHISKEVGTKAGSNGGSKGKGK
jgi:hypothetical protein